MADLDDELALFEAELAAAEAQVVEEPTKGKKPADKPSESLPPVAAPPSSAVPSKLPSAAPSPASSSSSLVTPSLPSASKSAISSTMRFVPHSVAVSRPASRPATISKPASMSQPALVMQKTIGPVPVPVPPPLPAHLLEESVPSPASSSSYSPPSYSAGPSIGPQIGPTIGPQMGPSLPASFLSSSSSSSILEGLAPAPPPPKGAEMYGLAPPPPPPPGAPGSNQPLNVKGSKSSGGKKHWRGIADEAWVDPTLDEWPKNDYRIWVGDLGNDVTDNTLGQAFRKYPSFAKAKVVVNKMTEKSRGYGFVSLLDPEDFLKAMKEMQGAFVGNRPIRIKRSDWEDRDVSGNEAKKIMALPTKRQKRD